MSFLTESSPYTIAIINKNKGGIIVCRKLNKGVCFGSYRYVIMKPEIPA